MPKISGINDYIGLYTTDQTNLSMADFVHPRDRKKSSKNHSPRRERGFGDKSRGNNRRFPGRDSNRNRGNRRDVEKTKVTCSACGKECEVPFKPISTKPVYCDECFAGKDSKSSKVSGKDLELINEKLDKIMKALDIE